MYGHNFTNIQYSQPLTKDDIRRLKNKQTYLGTDIEVGDRVFSYMLCTRENGEVTKKMEIGIETELPLLACDYFVEDETQRIPAFWKDI